MRLSSRLVLLVLGCLIPILTAQIYAEWTLRDARQARINSLVLHQAELASATLGGVVDEVVRFAKGVARLPDVAAAGPGCEDRLTALRHELSQYRFLAVYRAGGELLCGSAGVPGGSAGGQPGWIADLAAIRDVEFGPPVYPETSGAAFLPVGIRLPAGTGRIPACCSPRSTRAIWRNGCNRPWPIERGPSVTPHRWWWIVTAASWHDRATATTLAANPPCGNGPGCWPTGAPAACRW